MLKMNLRLNKAFIYNGLNYNAVIIIQSFYLVHILNAKRVPQPVNFVQLRWP